MSMFVVEGGARLSGSIAVYGNKNEALPAIAAALLCTGEVRLTNMPEIGDIRNMLKLAEALGAQVGPLADASVSIRTPEIAATTLPIKLSSAIRGSVLFASALLVRTGKAAVPQPGGDVIGRRRLDTHFQVFEALGAKLEVTRGGEEGVDAHTIFSLSAPKGLKGADIYLDEASVTGTENALIAAAGAAGHSTITNAASEPHVQGLCRLLQAMGVRIEGVGSNVLIVHGRTAFAPVTHAIGSDYIEAGSLIGLAATTGSQMAITNVDTQHLRMTLWQLGRLGVDVEVHADRRTIHVPAGQTLRVRRDLGNAIPRLDDAPWPGFPADLMSILLVVATQAEGTCLIWEKMFESRLFFVDRLIDMGAQIVLCDPHRAVIVGPSRLYGSTIASPNIRAGMALLIAAMAAEGTSTIHNVEQIDRGYQRIDERLIALGARISRVTDRRKSDGEGKGIE